LNGRIGIQHEAGLTQLSPHVEDGRADQRVERAVGPLHGEAAITGRPKV
jgi:hypothetical protein